MQAGERAEHLRVEVGDGRQVLTRQVAKNAFSDRVAQQQVDRRGGVEDEHALWQLGTRGGDGFAPRDLLDGIDLVEPL